MEFEYKKWLDEKLLDYKENKEETLERMLHNVDFLLEQYLNNPTSIVTKGVLESMYKCNKEFLNKIGKNN